MMVERDLLTGISLILVYFNNMTVFRKSIDATYVSLSCQYYFIIIAKVVDEVGEEKVLQVVTDNEPTVMA